MQFVFKSLNRGFGLAMVCIYLAAPAILRAETGYKGYLQIKFEEAFGFDRLPPFDYQNEPYLFLADEGGSHLAHVVKLTARTGAAR